MPGAARKSGPVLGLVFMMIFLLPQTTPAHGLGYAQLGAAPVVSIRFAYSTGDPLAYGAIKVYAPGNDKIEYQNGRTDASGCFAFLPNASGVWKLAAADGQGHALNVEIPVNLELEQNTGPELSVPAVPLELAGLGGLPLWLKALIGVSLLLNIYGAGYFLLRRKA